MDNVHIRHDTQIGHHTIVGEKSHISYNVNIGNFVKINAFVYICTAVTIEDGVMISAGCTFTNDRYPRAASDDLTQLRSSDPDDKTLSTIVRAGATLGARAVIGPGIIIGRFAMIGMGSVLTGRLPLWIDVRKSGTAHRLCLPVRRARAPVGGRGKSVC